MAMFEGYSPETVDFLWGIRLNNNREWFLEHKNDYVEKLYEPTKALGKDIFEKARHRISVPGIAYFIMVPSGLNRGSFSR